MAGLSKPLPAEDRLVLLPKNPGRFFIFWQLSAGRAEAFRSGAFAPEAELRLTYSDDKTHASSHRVPWQQAGAYLAVPAQGRVYEASFYAQRGGAWEKLLESNQAAAPSAAGMAEERAYASLEFHKRSQP
ncbi:MAG: hypothetical protein A2179_06495 [Elusimicrobia bacterium GWC2_63_65]|nr:MAG: hypothetical protein A2179_06495 [Elusimicrobia bacterium GWC2_63_65]